MMGGASEIRGQLPRTYSLALIAPVAVLLVAVFFVPIGNFLLRSFLEPAPTLVHYIRLFEEPLYLRVILRTLAISVAVAMVTLLAGYPIALLMTRLKGWVLVIVTGCVVIPLWTSVLVRSYGWIVILRRNGILNSYLQSLGISETPLKLLYTDGAVLVAMSQVLLPFMILPIYATLRNVSPDLERAALNLGAGPIRSFLSVTLPLSLPGVSAGCLIVFVLALGFYVTPALVGGPSTLMIATLISQQATEMLDWPLAGALSTLLLALALAVTFVFRRLLGVHAMVPHE